MSRAYPAQVAGGGNLIAIKWAVLWSAKRRASHSCSKPAAAHTARADHCACGRHTAAARNTANTVRPSSWTCHAASIARAARIVAARGVARHRNVAHSAMANGSVASMWQFPIRALDRMADRSEEHTSELQSRG